MLPEPANDTPAKPRDGTGAGQRRRNCGALPVHLERVEEVLDLTDQGCPCCGVAMRRIGEDRSERLDVVPAQLRVRVTIRPRYACRRCEEGVHQAPAPARAIPGGLPTEALLAQVLVAKYGDGLPLYRQAAILQRQGIHLDRSTLCDWVAKACWWLRPLHGLILAHVTSHARVFADDTPLPTLERERGRTRDGRIWAYAVDDRVCGGTGPPAVAYLYAPDRKGIRYGLRHWVGLERFLTDGRLELDTNIVEREIRPVAVTRKAALFAGSEGGGETWAIATTLIRTAVLNGLDPQAWLRDALERMVSGGVRSTQIATLLPWNWRQASLAAAA